MATRMINESFIPFGRPNMGDLEIEAVTKVLRSGWLGMGNETILFEKEIASFLGAEHVVTVSSCSAGLFLSLLASGVVAGDEVICPSLTWCATANAAIQLGAKPVFCDVNPETLCASVEDIISKVTPKTRAVTPVHYGGLACDIASLRERLPKHIAIIEDAAHAFGSKYTDGKMVGNSGNLTCFSFYANKNIATGEGGAIALNDKSLAERLKGLRAQGMNQNAWKRYISPEIFSGTTINELGYKMNYTDLQASIGRVQLRRISELREKRSSIAQYYYENINNVAFQSEVMSESHAKHLFVIFLPDKLSGQRDEILAELRNDDIGAAVHYIPLHQMPVYSETEISLASTEDVATRILTLPISSSMSGDDARKVVDAVNGIIERRLQNNG